jgi:two-component system, cell cycle response regulator
MAQFATRFATSTGALNAPPCGRSFTTGARATILYVLSMPQDSEKEYGSTKTLIVDTRAAPTGARSVGVFTVVGGLETGRVFAVSSGIEATFGRAEGCSFRFDDASVSGIHARVARVAQSHVLMDAGSTNGSYVNDVRVTAPVTLKDGDRVQLGSATFLRFSLVSEDEEKALRKMYEAALRDGLTGVFNRKHLEERLDAEVAYGLRHNTELSLVIFDVDHFKRVNDTHGHLAGDAVLKSVTQVLAAGVRTEDVLGRYGGEEFVIVTRGIAVGGAFLLADRLRATLAGTRIQFGNAAITVTASAGVASLVCCQGKTDKTTLLAIADARLYKAKQAGRNRVVAAG